MKFIRLNYGVLLILVCIIFSGCSSADSQKEPKIKDPYKGGVQVKNDFRWPEGKKAAVSLTFDDARPSQIDVGMPILDAQGVKATFYVSPQRLQERLKGWQQTVSQGHEIGNHTQNHPCSGNFPWARHKPLEEYTWEAIEDEMVRANAAIKKKLEIDATTFAYPCGQKFIGRGKSVQSYVPLVADKFLAGRGWGDENRNDPGYIDLFQLQATELDGLDFEQAKKLIEQAKEEGSWLIFAGHEVGLDGAQPLTVSRDTLQAISQYCQDPQNEVWIDTVASISRYIRSQRKISN